MVLKLTHATYVQPPECSKFKIQLNAFTNNYCCKVLQIPPDATVWWKDSLIMHFRKARRNVCTTIFRCGSFLSRLHCLLHLRSHVCFSIQRTISENLLVSVDNVKSHIITFTLVTILTSNHVISAKLTMIITELAKPGIRISEFW